MTNRTKSQKLCKPAAVAVASLLVTSLLGVGAAAAQDQLSQVPVPQPTVPEVFTLMGQYVRMAYNNEGFATLGYRMAQEQIGKEWIMLQFGVTLRKPTESYKLKREHLWITTPDGKTIQLATQQEYSAGGSEVRSLTKRAQTQKDSINYFPLDADQPCALQFFADIGGPGRQLAFDETELSWHRACGGRLFFRIPGGVKTGLHWLNIQFAGSQIQVPFRILTEDEEKQLKKNWQEYKKALEGSYEK